MHSPPRYFVRLGNEVRGPYEREQLQQLAEVDLITPATLVAPSAEGSWVSIESLGELRSIFRVRPDLSFKPTAFEVVNRDGGPLLDVREVVRHGSRPLPPGVLSQSIARGGPAGPGTGPDEENEVSAMVREVHQIEAAFAPPPPPPKRRPLSRRFKLCATLALLGNAVLVGIPVAYGGWNDLWTVLILKGWAILYNGGLVFLYYGLPRE